MAYNDDAVLARLSALNESHDSIATCAQWIMFHRRHAERSVQIWFQKLKESPSTRRLNLIYLSNEVVQQSKARHKDDFPVAFAPIIAEAAAVTYKGATPDVQNKVRRVVEVWRDRAVFQEPIQTAIENRIDDLDKARGAGKSGVNNATIVGPSVPAELMPLIAPTSTVSKLAMSYKAKATAASQEYIKNTDPDHPTPSANVFAARLNGLMKSLATAEVAVAECVKTRKDLIGALEKLLATNKSTLEAEERQLVELAERKFEIEQKKQDVEMAIMRGLVDKDSANRGPESEPEVNRPNVEALTPPPLSDDADFYEPEPAVPVYESGLASTQASNISPAGGLEALSTLASQYAAVPVSNGTSKKRKVENGDEIPELGNVGIDPEIDEMIRE